MMSAPLRPRSVVPGAEQVHQQQAMSISPHLLHPHGYQQQPLGLAGAQHPLSLAREPGSYFPTPSPSVQGQLQPGMDMGDGGRRVPGGAGEPSGWDGKAEEVQVAGWTAFQGMDMDMDMGAGMRRGSGAEGLEG